MATISPSAAKLVNGAPSMRASRLTVCPDGVLLDDDLVEGSPTPELVVASAHCGGEHQPFVEVPSVRLGPLLAEHDDERVDQFGRLDLGEVTELAEVDAEERDGRPVEGADGAQHRAVAAEADNDVGLGEWPFVGVVCEIELGAVIGSNQPS